MNNNNLTSDQAYFLQRMEKQFVHDPEEAFYFLDQKYMNTKAWEQYQKEYEALKMKFWKEHLISKFDAEKIGDFRKMMGDNPTAYGSINEKDEAGDCDQIELVKYLKTKTGVKVYFDDDDMVDEKGSYTILRGALTGFTVKDLVESIFFSR